MDEVSAFAAYSSQKKTKMLKHSKHAGNTKKSFPKKKNIIFKKSVPSHLITKNNSSKAMLNGSKFRSDSGSKKQRRKANKNKSSDLNTSQECSSNPDSEGLKTQNTKKSKRIALKNMKKIEETQLEDSNKIIMSTPNNDSINDGIEMFKWLIYPIALENFFNKFWEIAPFVVDRNDPKYYSKLISFEIIDKMLLNNHIEFTKNIDITSYKNGK